MPVSSYIIKFLEGLFLLGVAGCLVTIPMAAWGYFSVLLERDPEEAAAGGMETEKDSGPMRAEK